jgi:hypothetical protein
VKESCSNRIGGDRKRRDSVSMRLAENEERALEELRQELFAKYRIIDIRLYGSKARGEGREDFELDYDRNSRV